MVIGIIYFPYARAEGLGKFFAESPGRWTFPVAILSVILLIAPLGGQAVAVCTASCLTGCGAAWWFSSRLGGLTGDIYGAINEITEIAVLLFWLV
jgi:adenosylcobinamide-GDP ribazoletransferase